MPPTPYSSAVRRACSSGSPPDVGRDGAVDHASLPQADRYVAVVGADVGEHSALRHERREQREPRLKR